MLRSVLSYDSIELTMQFVNILLHIFNLECIISQRKRREYFNIDIRI